MNRRADDIHDHFRAILNDLTMQVSPEVEALIKEQMIRTFLQLDKEKEESREQLKKQVKELDNKPERLEEHFADPPDLLVWMR